MKSTSVLSWAALGAAAMVLAQDPANPSESGSASSTSSGAATTHTVTVGKADHKYVPDVTLAEVGDIVEFQFFPPNHSVVRAEYEYPCIPYEMTGRGKVGFFAGFHPVDAILDEPPVWRIRINDTDPIFYYCSAPGSCINYGMVGAINPNGSTSLVHQRELAENSAYSLNPGENFPEEGGPSLSSTGSSPTATSSPSSSTDDEASSTSDSAAASTSESSGGSGLSSGAIAGIAIGAAVVAIMAGAIFYLLGRQKSLRHLMRLGGSSNQPPPTAGGGGGPGGPPMSTNTFASVPAGYAAPMDGSGAPPYGSYMPNDQRTSHAPTAYSEVPPYSMQTPYQSNVDEAYAGAKLGQGPQRWSNVTHPNAQGHDGYQSPPLPSSPFLDQGRMSNNASPLLGPNATAPESLDGQLSPRLQQPHQTPVHELSSGQDEGRR